jgi:hypothetical protein
MIPDAKVGAVAAALRAIYLPVAPYKHPATAGRGTLPDETTRLGEILQQPKLDAFPHMRCHQARPQRPPPAQAPLRSLARLHHADTASRASGSESDSPAQINTLPSQRRGRPAESPSAADLHF